ncbi:hypothetical protein PoB_002047100 [Plakobranchus ocellatus]|uniref:Uncharacterized protein n=1 Tax=Plakobranchus ocellatus TaxID=259542 RepID=A0AAV3Z3T8_9GAST|nr:hypothetical protein PoB_002047100 [Plakobranchus ocellatus]
METPCRFYAIDEIGTMGCGAHLKLTCLMVVWCGFLLCPSASLDESTTSTTSRLSKLVLRKTPTITRGPGMNPKVEPQISSHFLQFQTKSASLVIFQLTYTMPFVLSLQSSTCCFDYVVSSYNKILRHTFEILNAKGEE